MQAWMRTAPWVRWAAGGLVLSALVGAPAIVMLRSGDPGPPAAGGASVQYKEVTAERGDFRLAVSASGLVRPIDRIELKSKASGHVEELSVEVGDFVEQGALIAKLDQSDDRAALAQAQADLDIARAELQLAEKNFARRQQLYKSQVIAKEAQDETELELAVARGKLVQATTAADRAAERMGDSVITAPVDGVILQKYVEKGQIIASGVSNVGGGTPIVDIATMGNVHIEAGIDEIDIGKIREGQVATIRAEAYPETVYRGEVVRMAPEARIDQNVTLFDVVVRVENTDGNLKSGMNATVEIVIVEQPEVLFVPVTALQKTAGKGNLSEEPPQSFVFVKDGGGYLRRDVRAGLTNYRVVEILDGLEEGEVIGIPMHSRLKEEHDRLDSRFRESRSFGSSDNKSKSR